MLRLLAYASVEPCPATLHGVVFSFFQKSPGVTDAADRNEREADRVSVLWVAVVLGTRDGDEHDSQGKNLGYDAVKRLARLQPAAWPARAPNSALEAFGAMLSR
jgi:hypothetical protein